MKLNTLYNICWNLMAHCQT